MWNWTMFTICFDLYGITFAWSNPLTSCTPMYRCRPKFHSNIGDATLLSLSCFKLITIYETWSIQIALIVLKFWPMPLCGGMFGMFGLDYRNCAPHVGRTEGIPLGHQQMSLQKSLRVHGIVLDFSWLSKSDPTVFCLTLLSLYFIVPITRGFIANSWFF